MKTSPPARRLLPVPVLLASALLSGAQVTNPILYVTQVAPAQAHHTVVSIDGSLQSSTAAAPRGGDLMILYPNLATKNLTRAAGYGIDGQLQTGDNAIAVRDPHVHWSGTKALFSMVKGAPANAKDARSFHWQIHEITGLGQGETPVITRVPWQNPGFNNAQPAYLSDGRIVYATDCTISGEQNLYPAIDEKGLGPAGTGLWTIDPNAPAGTPAMMTHAPSGAFEPFVDSFGRILFTRWDLLQRDELAAVPANHPYDFESEDPAAGYTPFAEVFPEPLRTFEEPFGLTFDLFLPWTINQDGQELNTLNHLGRHELTPDFPRSSSETGLQDFFANVPDLPPGGALPAITRATSFLHLSEHPSAPGRYLGVDVLATSLSAGRAVSLFAPPTTNPDLITVRLISQLGLVRDPSWLADGRLMGSWVPGPPLHHSHYGDVDNQPISPEFIPDDCFTIRVATGSVRLESGVSLVTPATLTTTQFVNGQEITRAANLWQLQPVEVRSRSVPAPLTVPLENPEASIFVRTGVSPAAFKTWLTQQNMAVLVSRNVTTRDQADRQQPFSLVVPGGAFTYNDETTTREIDRMQFFQGDYLRAYASTAESDPQPGRRITARALHDERFSANPPSDGPQGSVPLATDGSMAALVPAGRAISWQTADSDNKAVVRERYWLSFHAGEVRMCTSCHAANRADQSGNPPATNPPEALAALLAHWKSTNPAAAGPATPYNVWSEIRLQNANASTADDNDGDALTNLEEFAYGSDPLIPANESAEAKPLSFTGNSGGLTVMEFTRNKDATGLEVIAEASVNLGEWHESARINDTTATATAGSSIAEITSPDQRKQRLSAWKVSVAHAAGQVRQFFRLRFVMP